MPACVCSATASYAPRGVRRLFADGKPEVLPLGAILKAEVERRTLQPSDHGVLLSVLGTVPAVQQALQATGQRLRKAIAQHSDFELHTQSTGTGAQAPYVRLKSAMHPSLEAEPRGFAASSTLPSGTSTTSYFRPLSGPVLSVHQTLPTATASPQVAEPSCSSTCTHTPGPHLFGSPSKPPPPPKPPRPTSGPSGSLSGPAKGAEDKVLVGPEHRTVDRKVLEGAKARKERRPLLSEPSVLPGRGPKPVLARSTGESPKAPKRRELTSDLTNSPLGPEKAHKKPKTASAQVEAKVKPSKKKKKQQKLRLEELLEEPAQEVPREAPPSSEVSSEQQTPNALAVPTAPAKAVEPPPPPVFPARWRQSLSLGLKELDNSISPTEEQLSQHRQMLDVLQSMIEPLGGQLIAYGSSVTGLQTKASDLDITWVTPSEEDFHSHPEDARKWAFDKLHELLEVIGGEERILTPRGTKVMLVRCSDDLLPGIEQAKLIRASNRQGAPPVLRLEDAYGDALCDITMNNWDGLRNTTLLRCFGAASPTFKVLGRTVKHWARTQGIADRTNGKLSTYGLMLMVAGLLQRHKMMLPPAEVQVLCTKIREAKEEIDALNEIVEHAAHFPAGDTPLPGDGEMFLRFISLYADASSAQDGHTACLTTGDMANQVLCPLTGIDIEAQLKTRRHWRKIFSEFDRANQLLLRELQGLGSEGSGQLSPANLQILCSQLSPTPVIPPPPAVPASLLRGLRLQEVELPNALGRPQLPEPPELPARPCLNRPELPAPPCMSMPPPERCIK